MYMQSARHNVMDRENRWFILYTTSNNNLIHYCSVILEEKRREEKQNIEKGLS